MNIRTYTQQGRVLANSRFVLPREVNNHMAWWSKLASNCNAKVTFVPGIESPMGPMGHWVQTITVTVEGDCDDPKCKSLLDALLNNNQGIIQKLYEGDFSHIPKDNRPKITAPPAKVEEKTNNVPQRRAIAVSNSNTEALLKRAFFFLEDGEWDSADEYCETVLDLDPECAEAYLGKLLAELHVRKQDDLKDCAQPFDGKNNYQKTIRFADSELRRILQGYIVHINDRNERARLEGIYRETLTKLERSKTEAEYKATARIFNSIKYYRDSAALAQSCYEKAEIARKDAILADGKAKMTGESISNYESAINLFESISGWKDADEQVIACQRKTEEIKAKQEAERLEKERKAEIERKEAERIAKRNKKIAIITTPIVCAIIACIIVLNTVIIPNSKYNNAVALMDASKYEEAIAAFEALNGHKDSYSKIKDCETAILNGKYNDALALMEAGQYTEAIAAFEAMDGYKDSIAKIEECTLALIDNYYEDTGVLMDASETAKMAMAIYKYKNTKNEALRLWGEIAQRDTISAGDCHVVGLKTNGTVVAVGSNFGGECDVDDWTDIVAISARGYNTVGLKTDGTVVLAGDIFNVDWADIVAISAGYSHAVGLKADGTVIRTGMEKGDTGNWTDIVAISAGSWHTVGLKTDGTVVAVGDNDHGQCNVEDWIDIVAISASDHTVGLKADGTVIAVGRNDYGQCNVDDWTDIVAIYAGDYHTIGLKADGTVIAVGRNDYGQCNVDDWTDIVAISAGYDQTVGLKTDGTVVSTDNIYYNTGSWHHIRVPD